MKPYNSVITAQAPVNIAVLKYWGKSDELLKIPINDSISGTLNCSEMRTVTSIYINETYDNDRFWLNGREQELTEGKSPAKLMLDELRQKCQIDDGRKTCKVHIISVNNFPTAAGLASSAAGYACLSFVLGHTYGITDSIVLSRIARKGSGSACRSLYGGFVQWEKGYDHETSVAKQIVDHLHWPEMRVMICVVNDNQKEVSSSFGMAQSVATSSLLKYRSEKVVPERIGAMTVAIREKDFESFADLTMKDSNQFHSVCLDTFPPLFYMNESSKQIIKICSLLNVYYGKNKVAYTFDAGPNACIYMLDNFMGLFLGVVQHFFAREIGELVIKGCQDYPTGDKFELESLIKYLQSKGIETKKDNINYLITTSIGEGPKLLEEHLDDHN